MQFAGKGDAVNSAGRLEPVLCRTIFQKRSANPFIPDIVQIYPPGCEIAECQNTGSIPKANTLLHAVHAHLDFKIDGTLDNFIIKGGDKDYCNALKVAAKRARFPAFTDQHVFDVMGSARWNMEGQP